MSCISSVSSTANPYQAQLLSQNGIAQVGNSLLAIGTALQSGTSTDAQTALANFQQSVSTNLQNSAAQLFSANKQASSAYQTLVSDINSGNSSGAQQAYSNLLAALQSAQTNQAPKSAHHGHHHHHHGAGSATSSTTSATSPGGAGASGSATDSDGDNDGIALNAAA